MGHFEKKKKVSVTHNFGPIPKLRETAELQGNVTHISVESSLIFWECYLGINFFFCCTELHILKCTRNLENSTTLDTVYSIKEALGA